jgi:hypothetical protein
MRAPSHAVQILPLIISHTSCAQPDNTGFLQTPQYEKSAVRHLQKILYPVTVYLIANDRFSIIGKAFHEYIKNKSTPAGRQ